MKSTKHWKILKRKKEGGSGQPPNGRRSFAQTTTRTRNHGFRTSRTTFSVTGSCKEVKLCLKFFIGPSNFGFTLFELINSFTKSNSLKFKLTRFVHDYCRIDLVIYLFV